MLTLLKIRNLALVDELVWELGPGLIGVTGETGAGKSVIVGALKLVLGERAEKSLIRTGEESCSVEAVFELKDPAEVNAVLADGGLEACDDTQLIIRRVIGQSANRQFVNDSPVTLALLKRLGENLVDLHGPHDHQSLLSVERQLSMLDAYAGAEPAVAKYRETYRKWREKAVELDEIRHAENASEQELDLLRYQLQEIDGANLKPEDEQDLEDRWRRASNSSRLVEAAAAATAALSGDDGILERLTEVQRLVRDLEKLDPSIRERTASLETACLELQDLEGNLTDYADELDINPAEAATLEERVNLLESLKRKYGPSLTDVLARRDAAATRLDTIENRGEKLELLERELAACREALNVAGKALGTLRKKAAPKLAKEISSQLKDLGFKQSSFEMPLKLLTDPGPQGLGGGGIPVRPESGRAASAAAPDRVVRRNQPGDAGGEIGFGGSGRDAADGFRRDRRERRRRGRPRGRAQDGDTGHATSSRGHHPLPAGRGDVGTPFRGREGSDRGPDAVATLSGSRRDTHPGAGADVRRRWRAGTGDGRVLAQPLSRRSNLKGTGVPGLSFAQAGSSGLTRSELSSGMTTLGRSSAMFR